MDCQYCNGPVDIVTGELIYPHREDLWERKFYLCKPCNAYVGCHKKNNSPLGTVAKEELRKLRSRCHELFDPLWQVHRKRSRSAWYAWLKTKCDVADSPATLRGKPVHFGSCNEEDCKFIIKLLEGVYE